MKTRLAPIAALVVLAAAALVVARLCRDNHLLRQGVARQTAEVQRLSEALSAANEHAGRDLQLAAGAAGASSSPVFSQTTESAQANEMLRLRGQVGQLRQQSSAHQERLAALQGQLDESLLRAADWGETGKVLTAVEAVALRHLSTASKTKMLKDAVSALMELAQTNTTGLWIHPSQVSPELRVPLQSLAQEEGFEVLYEGPLRNLQSPAQTIVVRQREPERWPDGSFSRAYAFADGHVQIHKTADGKFDDWESERTAVPPKQQTP